MTRPTALTTLALAIALGSNGYRSVANDISIDAAVKDESDIYIAFVDKWTGRNKSPISVANKTEELSPEDIQKFTDCAGGDGQWTAATPVSDIARDLGRLAYVHLVDPAKWRPQDPGALIANGVKVKTAVDAGISHGLLTLSEIRFNTKHQTAAFRYSFACGELCGTGGVVLFEKKKKAWLRSKKQCGGWIS